jgi:hypothetical protein
MFVEYFYPQLVKREFVKVSVYWGSEQAAMWYRETWTQPNNTVTTNSTWEPIEPAKHELQAMCQLSRMKYAEWENNAGFEQYNAWVDNGYVDDIPF